MAKSAASPSGIAPGFSQDMAHLAGLGVALAGIALVPFLSLNDFYLQILITIGVMAVFAAKRHLTRTIVMVGTITDWPIAQRSLDEVAALHNVKFIVPDHAAFATAIGAALSE